MSEINAEAIKEDKKNDIILKVFNILKYVLVSFLVAMSFIEMTMSTTIFCQSGSLKSIRMWKGIFFLSFSLMIAIGFSIRRVSNWVSVVIFYAVALILLYRLPLRINSPELWQWQLYRDISLGTLLPLIINAIIEKKIKIPNVFSAIYMALIAAFGLCVYIFDYDRVDIPYVCLMVIIYSLIQHNKTKLNKWCIAFLIGCYFGAMYVSVKGFFVPKDFFQQYFTPSKIYYQGIFETPGRYGEVAGYIVLVCFILFYLSIKRYKKIDWITVLLISIGIIPAVALLLKNNTKGASFALILIFLFLAYIVLDYFKKSKYFFVVLVSLTVLFILTALFSYGLLKKYPYIKDEKEWMYASFKTKYPILKRLRDYAIRYVERRDYFSSKYKVLSENSFLNYIDLLASGRVSIAILTIERLNFFGHNDFVFIFDEARGLDAQPHAAFLYCLYRFGIIIGGLIVAAMIELFVKSIVDIKSITQKKYNNIINIVLMFWGAYCMLVFMCEAMRIFESSVVVWLFLGSLALSRNARKKKKETR